MLAARCDSFGRHPRLVYGLDPIAFGMGARALAVPEDHSSAKPVPPGGRDRYIKELLIARTMSPAAGKSEGPHRPGMPGPTAAHRATRGAAGERRDLDAGGGQQRR